MGKYFIHFCLGICSLFSLHAQDTGSIYRGLEKLNFLGSMLYVAAHPDDENTALNLALSLIMFTPTAAYLIPDPRRWGAKSHWHGTTGITRALFAPNELMQARSIDGGNQYFTSAIDFGFSKHPRTKPLKIWDKDRILGEVVGRIRAFQPDIISPSF